MPIIGLTGNFGMGKSTVLGMFSKLGAYTFNVDDFVHDIIADPEIIKEITKVLGRGVLINKRGGISLNKKRMADIIFNDPRKRKAIEKIIHPEVLKAMNFTADDILSREPSATIIVEVPLLFEADYKKYFNATIVVYCTRDAAIKRLLKKGFSRDEALKRIRAQMPITTKKKLSDYIINNNGTVKITEREVKTVYDELMKY